ncbi:low temperature requirement protein A [Streptomyces sp. NPDC002889]|uniref:low temperature requirement protein A n=1 Tax=Streptomyces sp. NPDC002889 TaxID=3364669 RepID=UPI0036A82A05
MTNGERHAGWLELFYDLMFVAFVAQLAHPLAGSPSVGAALTMLALFAPAWWLWVSSTLYTNLFGEGGPERRISVLGQMAVVLIMAGGAEEAAHGQPALFAGAYVAGRAGLLVVRWLLGGRQPQGGSNTAVLISMAFWTASIPLHPPLTYLLWAAGLATEVGSTLYRRSLPELEISHLVERFGLFVIIVLGEGVAQLVAALAAVHSTAQAMATAIPAFAVLAALWWVYFDFGSAVAASALRARGDERFPLARRLFVYGHFVPVAALVALGAGLGALVRAAPAPRDGVLPLICAALAAYFCNNSICAVAVVGRPAATQIRWLAPTLLLLALLGLLGQNLTPALQVTAALAAFTLPTAVDGLMARKMPAP